MLRQDHLILFALVLTSSVMLTGCTVGPDYSRPRTEASDAAGFVNVPKDWAGADNLEGPCSWWKSFGDPVVGKLVQEAIENNNELKAAAARVVEARALLAQSHGIRLPSVDYGGNRTRAKTSTALLGGRTSFLSTSYAQDLTVNYIGDLFGKLKRAEQAAFADLLSTQANQIALTHSIIAQVVRTRTQIATAQRLVDIAEARIESWEDTLKIVKRRYEAGLIGSVEVHLAKENLAAAEVIKPRAQKALDLARYSLDVLLARRPAASEPLPETLPDLPKLEPIPLCFPAAMLDRRPDVVAAEMELSAATERVGVSVAEMFPDLTFTASGGYRSERFSNIFDSQGTVYSAIMRLAAPIYRGGALKAGVEAAKARTEQAAAKYAGVVLKAMREVEDALVMEKYISEEIEILTRRVDEASKAETLATQRYSRGVDSLLLVLESQRRKSIAENELAIAKGQLWNARVDLILAIGGDWNIYPNLEYERVESDS